MMGQPLDKAVESGLVEQTFAEPADKTRLRSSCKRRIKALAWGKLNKGSNIGPPEGLRGIAQASGREVECSWASIAVSSMTSKTACNSAMSPLQDFNEASGWVE